MVKAKAELECTLAEKEQHLNAVKGKYQIHSPPSGGKVTAGPGSISNDDESSSNASLQQQASNTSTTTTSPPKLIDNSKGNLLIYDTKDPNRPRFTLKELQKVLMEKNELTVKLDQTQDELELLRKQ
jgi:hypothetical protein